MKQLPDSVYYDLEAVHEYGINIEGREIFITGEPESLAADDGEEPGVEFMMASRLIKNIRFLTMRGHEPILIHQKTDGGDWHEGMSMHNAIASCPAHVTILSYTHARSMSSLIFQASDHRVMMPDSIFMFHLGTYGASGTQRGVESEMDFYRKTTARMVNIYTDAIMASNAPRFSGWGAVKIRNKLHREMEKKEDVYLDAEEAVDWGLADTVFDGDWDKLKGKK